MTKEEVKDLWGCLHIAVEVSKWSHEAKLFCIEAEDPKSKFNAMYPWRRVIFKGKDTWFPEKKSVQSVFQKG